MMMAMELALVVDDQILLPKHYRLWHQLNQNHKVRIYDEFALASNRFRANALHTRNKWKIRQTLYNEINAVYPSETYSYRLVN